MTYVFSLMLKSLFKSEGFLFIIKFLSLFALLYFFCIVFISITYRASNPFYLFLRDYLNYIDWLRYSVLRTSEFLCKLIGVESYIEDRIIIHVSNSPKKLHMGYDCIGYGVMSFWAAFVIANKTKFTKKVYWLIGGCIIIWLINCIRVAFLLTALRNNWPISKYVDHHTTFNIISYILILGLIFTYIKLNKTKVNPITS